MDHIAALLPGVGTGAVYAALALALVLTYRSSGVINFATGAMALYGAYTYASLRKGQLIVLIPGLPKTVRLGNSLGVAPSILISLVLCALLGALVYLLVFRPLREAPPLARAVASLGVLVVIQGLMAIRHGSAPVTVAPIFPAHRWELGQVAVLSDRVYLALAVVALTAVLAAIYRFTRFGLLTRATAASQSGAFVSGVSPDRVALVNWMLSATVAGLAGILIAPISPLTPISYTLFVVPALAAALVGGFQHLVPAVAAGVGIGLVQSWVVTESQVLSWLPGSGMAELVPLIVVLVALLVTGRAIPIRGELIRHPLGRAPRPRAPLLTTAVGGAVGVAALLVTSGSWRAGVIGTFIAAIIALSLVVVTGYAGQVSVAQLALAGVGAFTLSFLTQTWGVPFPLAPLLSAAVAAGVGVVIGLPALRLRGLTLGIVTVAFAYALEAGWFRNARFVDAAGAKVADPRMLGLDLSVGFGDNFPRLPFGLLCLFTLLAVAYGVARLRVSALGSAMLAVRANERSAAGLGVNVVRVKIVSFGIASFIAGLGGALLAYRRGVVTYESYATLAGLALLSTAYLAGVTSVSGGVLAGVFASSGIVFLAMERSIDLGEWFGVLASIGLIITLIRNPEGLAAGVHAIADRLPLDRLRHPRPGAAPSLAATATSIVGREPILEVRDLSVRYGGVLAVDGVDLAVRPGTIVGLIGPNGAGKTSVIDAITGFSRCTGRIHLVEEDIGGLRPHARVRRGLARTFQDIELYDDLTVEENVSVAVAGDLRVDHGVAVAGALSLVGIAQLRDRPAGELSQGERQLVAIARAVAARPSVLLLDEPAAGLDSAESHQLGERLRAIAASGTGVLLVDHDVALVLRVCHEIYVLDFGRVIAHGDPAVIRADRAVTDAYLGNIHDTTTVAS